MTTAQFNGYQLADISEEAFQNDVIDIAHQYGFLVAHFRIVKVQRANGTTFYQVPVAADGKGWPDLVLVGPRIVYAELKAMNGILSPEQKVWRDALLKAGGEWYCWKPSDYDAIHRVLGGKQ